MNDRDSRLNEIIPHFFLAKIIPDTQSINKHSNFGAIVNVIEIVPHCEGKKEQAAAGSCLRIVASHSQSAAQSNLRSLFCAIINNKTR